MFGWLVVTYTYLLSVVIVTLPFGVFGPRDVYRREFAGQSVFHVCRIGWGRSKSQFVSSVVDAPPPAAKLAFSRTEKSVILVTPPDGFLFFKCTRLRIFSWSDGKTKRMRREWEDPEEGGVTRELRNMRLLGLSHDFWGGMIDTR